jgi:hypothetical protein
MVTVSGAGFGEYMTSANDFAEGNQPLDGDKPFHRDAAGPSKSRPVGGSPTADPGGDDRRVDSAGLSLRESSERSVKPSSELNRSTHSSHAEDAGPAELADNSDRFGDSPHEEGSCRADGWLADFELALPEERERLREQLRSWPAEDRTRLGQLLALHGMLETLLVPAAEPQEQQIARVMSAIRHTGSTRSATLASASTPAARASLEFAKTASHAREFRSEAVTAIGERSAVPARRFPSRRRWWISSLAGLAALVLIGLLMTSGATPRQRAVAAIEGALRDVSANDDRQYRVITRWAASNGPPRDLAAELWVKGHERFVLRQPTRWGEVVMGCDGQQHWLVLPFGPVIVGHDPSILEQLLLRKPQAAPFLDLSTILQRMKTDYRIEAQQVETVVLPDTAEAISALKIVGTRLPTARDMSPDEVQLWTHEGTGIACRVKLEWTSPREWALASMEIDWRGRTSPVPSTWYRHHSHHAADRSVWQRPTTIDLKSLLPLAKPTSRSTDDSAQPSPSDSPKNAAANPTSQPSTAP